jgi:hypothetical protein
MLFQLWRHPNPKPGRPEEFQNLGRAIEVALMEATYGNYDRVHITSNDEDYTILVDFKAKEMRHASQCQREASELQVSAGVHGGL